MLTQIAAVRVALDPAGRAILEHQIEHDVTEAVEQGHPDQAIKDLMQALDRFILSTQLLATLYPDGSALWHDWAHLEFDDELGGRLVFPDGRRAIHSGHPEFSVARTWLVSANRRQCGERRRTAAGPLHARGGDSAARSSALASADCLGRPLQSGADGQPVRADLGGATAAASLGAPGVDPGARAPSGGERA